MAGARGPASGIGTAHEDLWSKIEAAGPLHEPPPICDPFGGLEDAEASERSRSQYDRRRSFIALYAWAVPTENAVAEIRDFVGSRPLLEVFAGSGLWSRLLSEAGLHVVATDAAFDRDAGYFSVEVAEAEAAVHNHPESTALLMCWPLFRSDAAYRALGAFSGDRLIYCGDRRFTAEQRFHELVAREWERQYEILLPSWPGLDDRAYLYSRKTQM